MSANVLLQYYVERPSAEKLQEQFSEALKNPENSYLVFHIWGIGGLGKTTLTRKLQEKFEEEAEFLKVSFGITKGIDTSIKLMKKFHQQYLELVPTNILRKNVSDLEIDDFKKLFQKDSFQELYQQYQDGIKQLQTTTISGKVGVDKEQLNLVRSLVAQGTKFAVKIFPPASSLTEPLAEKGGEMIVDTANALLSEKDRIIQLLQQHQATKKDKALQELLLNPIPKLTEALVQTLAKCNKPLVLIFDTYEKVLPEVDSWLWQSLIANTDVQNSPVRIIIAGGRKFLRSESWRNLKQDYDCVFDFKLERFDKKQTKQYLNKIGIKNNQLITQIVKKSKGLPYYLNKIRERREKGQEIDYFQLNEETVSLLLQGINKTQKQVIQLASCSHWFSKSLIKFLLKKNEELDFETAVDDSIDCFEWLKKLDFVEYVQGVYRLDDVARDIFRESLYLDDRELFEQTHRNLANYFYKLAQDEADNYNPLEQYENSAWRKAISEYLYHCLYGNSDNCQEELISYLFTSRYLNQDKIVQIPVKVILQENNVQRLLLKEKNYNFIKNISIIVFYGQFLLHVDQVDYDTLSNEIGLNKSSIDDSLNNCFLYLDKLTGLAKNLGFYCQSKRVQKNQQLKLLNQSYQVAKSIIKDYHPDLLSDLFFWNLGNEYFRLNEYEKAIKSYEQALTIQSHHVGALFGLYLVMIKLEKFDEAVNYCDKALEISPDDYKILANRGYALAMLKRYNDAIESYDQAIVIKSDNYQLWNSKGYILHLLGKHKDAIDSYDKSLVINPSDQNVWIQRANDLLMLGRVEDAINSFNDALKINSDNHIIWILQGSALGMLKRFDESLASFNNALEINSDNYEIWSGRGYVLAKLGKYEEAIESCDKALEIKPNHENSFYIKACCYALQNQLDLALENLEKAINLDDKNRNMAKTGTDFDSIRDDPRFQELLNKK